MLTEPAFRPHEVDAERQVIVEEILMNLDVPEDHVHTLLAEALFPGHPLGREVLGTRETVEAATRDQIAEFFGRWYRPRNLVVVAAGDLEHERRRRGVRRHARPARGRRAARAVPPRGRRSSRVAVLDDDTEQVHVAMGWRGVDHFDDDRYALSVANQILGGGMSSRLFQQVREERGLCYSVYSWASSYGDAGTAGIYAGTAPARVAELLQVVDDEVAKLVATGVTEAELDVAKGFIEGSMVLGLEDSGSRMARLGRSLHGPRRDRRRRRAAGPHPRRDHRRRGRGVVPGVRQPQVAGRGRPRRPVAAALTRPSAALDHLAGGHLDHPVDADGVEHRAVVGDEDERAAERLDGLLELLDRLEVEVVGGLVEHEDVDAADLQHRQRGAGALAGRQRLGGPLDVLGRQPELGQRRPSGGPVLDAGGGVEAGDERGRTREQVARAG